MSSDSEEDISKHAGIFVDQADDDNQDSSTQFAFGSSSPKEKQSTQINSQKQTQPEKGFLNPFKVGFQELN